MGGISNAINSVIGVGNDTLGGFLGRSTGFQHYSPAQIDRSQFMASPQEQALIDRLEKQSLGTAGPSIAELQMGKGLNDIYASSISQAAGNRALNSGLAQRLAMQNYGEASANLAGQASLLRAQEQQGANQALLGALQSVRTGKIAGEQLNQQRAKTESDAYQDAAKLGQQTLANIGKSMAMAGFGGTGAALGGAKASSGLEVFGPEIKNGDHPANDVIPAMLSAGEIVIPKEVASMSPENIGLFVATLRKLNNG